MWVGAKMAVTLDVFGYTFSVVDMLIVMVGVSMLPLAVDLLNTFLPIGRIVSQYTSRVLIAMLVCLYSAALYFFFALVVPFSLETAADGGEWWTPTSTAAVAGASVFCVWLWINTVYCYYQAIMQSPSKLVAARAKAREANVPSGLRKREGPERGPPEDKGNSVAEERVDAGEGGERIRVCRVCRVPRTATTHHCRQCGRCIPHMDHHCPFTANCVSTGPKGNFVFFFLFIFYTTVGCLFACATNALPFYHCFLLGEESIACSYVGSMSIILIPGIVATLGVGTLTAAHIAMILAGKSTLQVLRWWYRDNTVELDPEHEAGLAKLRGTWLQLVFPTTIPLSREADSL